jgi:two-component system nitrogen regulation sensor histidine kinase NtrY
MGRLELKLLVVLVLLTVVPLAVVYFLASPVFERALTVGGLNPAIEGALTDAVDVYGAFIMAEKQRQAATAGRLAESRGLVSAATKGPAVTTAWLQQQMTDPRVLAIELVPPQGGVAITVRAQDDDLERWRTRTMELTLEGVPGYGEMRFTYGIERAFLERFQRMDREVITPFTAMETYREELVSDLALRFMVPLTAALAFAALIAVVVGRRTTRRLLHLRDGMKAVAAGQLDAHVTPRGHDEVAELAHGFNEMAHRLRESQARVAYLTRVSAWQGIARRLAHEIKNPLTPILLSVQQAHGSYEGADARHLGVLETTREIVEQEVRTLERLVDNFSRFAQLPEPDRKACDLVALVRDLLKSHPEIEGLGAELPETPVVAEVDRDLLRQALTNVIKNAHEAVGGAEGDPEVTVTVLQAGDVVTLRIDDNGPGVDPDDRDRVFEPYVTGKTDGTGLGLAIVKKVVLDHGGRIEVTESPLGGARFSVILPRVVGSAADSI